MARDTGSTSWYKRWWAITLFVIIGIGVIIFSLSIFLVIVIFITAQSGDTDADAVENYTVDDTVTFDPYAEFDSGPDSQIYKDYYKTSKFVRNETRKTVHTDYQYDVKVEECGQANAFYSPRDRTIVVCEELAYDAARTFYPIIRQEYGSNVTPLDPRVWSAVYSTVQFILQHEEGHAYIDLNDVPITGREEDVADQFAFSLDYFFYIVLTDLYPEDNLTKNEKSINAAKWFFLGSDDELSSLAFYDEHGLDKQRYYNIMCWVYGTGPQEYSYFVEEGYLPEERAKRCVYESYQVRRGFLTVFKDASEYYSAKFLAIPSS
ncbi:hypothetical protein HY493_02130 [Candidatus Woesearchaeota archaeon]|nr:hypothetical protein [Candidatus Woesearchaeota archaeon]